MHFRLLMQNLLSTWRLWGKLYSICGAVCYEITNSVSNRKLSSGCNSILQGSNVSEIGLELFQLCIQISVCKKCDLLLIVIEDILMT